MRAVRFHDWDTSPTLDEVPEPVRAPGEVLVEVHAAAMAHLDLTVASGTFGMHPPLPYTGGVEGAGVVLDADPEHPVQPGAQVMLRGAGLGLVRDGCWTERVSVPAKAVTELPEGLPAPVGATFFVPATTAYVALHDVARLTAGEQVIVVGAAGAVGSMVAQLALAHGATVLGVVGRAEQLAWLPDGVTGVDAGAPEATAQLATAREASLLVDTLGGPVGDTDLPARAAWVRPGGRAVVIGYATGASVSLDLPSWLLNDVALLPVNMIRQERRAREVSGELARRLVTGELRLAVHGFGLDDAATALTRLRSGQVRGRAVLEP
jgi:NADPH:quinone reductase-like Zn-dependent oxidoreductase